MCWRARWREAGAKEWSRRSDVVGGQFHVMAAALGISAILAASAVAFHTVKYAGAAYLVFLGIRMIRSRNEAMPEKRKRRARRVPAGNFYGSVESEDGAVFSFIHSAIYCAGAWHVFWQFVMLE